MTEIILNESLDEARNKVVRAFDNTQGIQKYQKSQFQVVGETGVSFPRVLWSYGESVYADLSETGQFNKTKVEVHAEKEVSLNVGADPEKYKRRFLDELESLREKPLTTSRSDGPIPTANANSIEKSSIDTETTTNSGSNGSIPTANSDVEMEEGSGNGTSTLMLVIGAMMVFFFGIWFLMMLSMPY